MMAQLMLKRVAWIATKYVIYATLVIYLWKIGFWHFVFVGLPWLITYVLSLAVEYGWNAVLRYYAIWWTVAAILTIILIVLVFELIWRVHRKDFVIGGELEGRVVWWRGLRTGLIYDWWDLYNFVMHYSNKKKEKVSKIQRSSNDTERRVGTWPDPFAIGLGERIATHYVVYLKRSIFQMKPEKWYIPRNTELGVTLWAISIPNVDIVSRPRKDLPGKLTYHFAGDRPISYEQRASHFTKRNRTLLGRSHKLVERAILSDSETQKTDFAHGSFAVPQVVEDEEVYDA